MPEIKKIQYGGQTIDMPADMSLEDAKAQMARFFPELAAPKVETKKDGDKTIYVFSKQAGTKGALEHCPNCKELMLGLYHKCEPRWEYRLDRYILDPDDRWLAVFAPDAEKAAEKAARKEWDYEDGDDMKIWVRKPGEMTATLYPVGVSMEPVFRAVGAYMLKDGRRETRQLPEVEEN